MDLFLKAFWVEQIIQARDVKDILSLQKSLLYSNVKMTRICTGFRLANY